MVGVVQKVAPDASVTYVDRPMTDLQSALARPVRVASYVDNPASTNTPNLGWDVLKLWFADTYVSKRMQHYFGIRGTIKIRLEFTANPMLNGSRVWAINRVPSLPLLLPDTKNQFYAANGAFSGAAMPVGNLGDWDCRTTFTKPIKVVITPQSENETELIVPYADCLAHYTKNLGTGPGPVQLITSVITPISKMDGTAMTSATSPVYGIYVSFENAEVFMFTQFQSTSENVYRAASGTMAKVSSFANKMGVNTTAVDMARRVGDTVASALGYSKPPLKVNLALENRAFTNLVSFNGEFGGIVMADDMRDGFPVKPVVECDNPMANETDIAVLGSIPGIIATQSAWSYIHGTNNVLWSASVGFEQFETTGHAVYGWRATPGDYMIQPFRFYAYDSIVYTFHFDCNSYYKGVVTAYFDPVASTPYTVGAPLNLGTTVMMKTIAVSGETVAEFEVPYSQRGDWLNVYYDSAVTPSWQRSTGGVVSLHVQTKLMCGFSETPSLKFWVTKHYKGLRVADYRPSNLMNWSIDPNYQTFAAANQSSPLGALDMGESLTNINQILKIATPTFMIPQKIGTFTGVNAMYYDLSLPILPVCANSSANASYTKNSAVWQASHPLIYFSSLYLAKTGTTRMYVSFPDAYAFATAGSCWVSKPVENVPTCNINANSLFTAWDQVPLRETVESGDGLRFELEAKMQNNRYCGGSYFPSMQNTSKCPTLKMLCSVAKNSLTRFPAVVRVDYAAGESYTLSCFNGVPPLYHFQAPNVTAGVPVTASMTTAQSENSAGFLTHEEDNSEPSDGDHPALVEGTLSVERKD